MALRLRRSIRDLEDDYDRGNKKPLEDLIRAWRGIQAQPADDPNSAFPPKSFFTIAGYHREPFRGAGWGNSQWWGGYCNHGNVLFPTWHRAYLLTLENALRSVPGCENVTLPYWDEVDQRTKETGLPRTFLQKTFVLDGNPVSNPLYSYTFQYDIFDNLAPIPDFDYSKPEGYTTVRYPYSGLVGTPDDKAKTEVHNKTYKDMPEAKVNQILNENVQNWLGFGIKLNTGEYLYTGTREKYYACLNAPNYTVFSNTTSATQWNEDHFGVKKWQEAGSPTPATQAVVPLESPHNDMHLAIGGFDLPVSPTRPGQPEQSFDAIADANGDVGENDTASFDPIFYFHHCFIDRMFWLWQNRTQKTESLDIIHGYPGTNTVDNQGPTPGVPANTWLTMDSPLNPFFKDDRPVTSNDVINIETQLNYTYPRLSESDPLHPSEPLLGSPPASSPPTLRVSGINRGAISGSFVLSIYATLEGQTRLMGVESVLSRWHTSGCANCQTHLNVKTFVPLHGLTLEEAEKADFDVGRLTRGLVQLPERPPVTHLGQMVRRMS
ncbi:hypothetical protein W97_01364 [Coniosporium apollinis CBS 100218]|uniref:tyrosinase n=1 Tax=Coniosporium apollinis (strain CBS 100218) TaxID=1168221 RepID=R7YJT1_CONA1|nr:uncharacterized protein W97_01364 [Coniosporium apollinis CBS 100218]EON62145.1 hypothetical protein W97_01364 [Coniosporium apollinis CBS 100218]